MTTPTFLDSFRSVETIGATPAGGVDRQAATPEDKQTRDWFRDYAAHYGWRVEVDAIGNLFAMLDWVDDAPFVLIGSHLDSQPLAGRFDGAYGVLAALDAARTIDAEVRVGDYTPRFNLAVVNWFNEEGSRFAPSVMGSSVFTGLFDLEETLDITDLDGVSVREALDAIGYRGSSEAGPRRVVSYAEIHIEQGRILERAGIAIGLVESSWYTQKLNVRVLGEQSHTGATAMADRHDALVAASKVIVAVHDITGEFPEESLVSSVGRMTLEPNSPIVVARQVDLVADLRSASPEIVGRARGLLLERFEAIAAEHGVSIEAVDFDIREIRTFPAEGVELGEKVASDLGISWRHIQTMAGHDSVAMNTRTPSVMLFIPSVDGVSHCEREFTTDEDMVRGVEMFTEMVRRLAAGDLAGPAVELSA